jgi:hypothetical protein
VSRVPRPLARRIDRLARRAHAFHRWSHHPLCDRYAGEVVRLGRRTRLCRGCALAVLGATLGGAAGLAAGLAAPAAPGGAWLAAAALLAAAVPLALPRHPPPAGAPSGRRAPKILTRLLPLAVAGGAAGQALAAPTPGRLAAAAIAVAAIALGVLRYRRRGPDRGACLGCPEAPPGMGCSGFRLAARRERAFSRLTSRWIAAASAAGGVAGPANE